MSHPELEEHLREAVAARRAGRTEDGWRHLIAAEAICRSMGRRRDLVTTLAGMAQLHRDAADFASALPLYEEAVVHAQQMRNPIVRARALRHLGEVTSSRASPNAKRHWRGCGAAGLTVRVAPGRYFGGAVSAPWPLNTRRR